jgi:hypothetical protein
LLGLGKKKEGKRDDHHLSSQLWNELELSAGIQSRSFNTQRVYQ